MEYKNLLNPYTANSKVRACTKKALTKDKVNALNAKMADQCDKSIAKDRAKAELRNKREAFKQARLARQAA
jgi:hypothetical protein